MASRYQPDSSQVAEIMGLQGMVNEMMRVNREWLAAHPLPPTPPRPWWYRQWRRLYWAWTGATKRPRRWLAYRIYRFYEDEGW